LYSSNAPFVLPPNNHTPVIMAAVSEAERVAKCLDMATELKDAGNALFAAKEYSKAINKYAKMFGYAKLMETPAIANSLNVAPRPPLPKELIERSKSLLLTANLNIAACYLQLSSPAKAKEYAEDALKLDPESTKGLYRLARAYYLMKDYSGAETTLKELSRLHEKHGTVPDTSVQQLERLVREAQRREDDKLASKLRSGLSQLKLYDDNPTDTTQSEQKSGVQSSEVASIQPSTTNEDSEAGLTSSQNTSSSTTPQPHHEPSKENEADSR